MMTNSTRSINNLSTIDEQLLTDVTSEQAAIVEGGLSRVQLLQLRCIEAGGGSDQVFATFNGVDTSFGRTKLMRKGFAANFSQSGGPGNSIVVRLRDKGDGNLIVGKFTVSSPASNPKTKRVSAGGSTYDVTYTAF